MTPNNGNQPTYQLHPIGYVRAQEGSFTLEILPPYRPALKEMRQFSHVLIFWWANQHDNAADRARTTTELPYAPGVEAGVFACRAPYRPNPIALTTMFILDVDEANGIVTLPWIDAEDGTPLLDLKPYIPISDRIRDVGVAEWLKGWPEWMEDAALEFSSFTAIPPYLVNQTLPAGEYLCITHTGQANSLTLTLDYLYHTWLRKTGAKPASHSELITWDATGQPTQVFILLR